MRHHFVPQFLLREWTGSDNLLQQFTLHERGVSPQRVSPRSTGYQDDLVALTRDEVAGMNKQDVELRYFQRVDREAALVRTKMLENGLRSLTNEDRTFWTHFLVSLWSRQPSTVREFVTEGAKRFAAVLDEPLPEDWKPDEGDEPILSMKEWAEREFPGIVENFGLSVMAEISVDSEVAKKVFRMRSWLWDVSKGGHSLLLGDNPCIRTGGVDDPELVIALPISPRFAFMATSGDRTATRLKRLSATELASLMNESAVLDATRKVYALSRAPMAFIEKRRSKG